ncbi:DsbA family protein [Pantoea vagans]|uniref:DsbA family protein n=1 Tax=Pantoea vagans TaxID=470934 RepID=UPI0028AB3C65|nr:thioredoxin domain-containing protein [Pantoea vagans]
MKKYMNLAAIALAISTVVPAVSAAETADFSAAQQARIGEIAADYLVAHPEILIEVSKKLQARQADMQRNARVDAVLKGHRLLMQLENVPVKGPANSGVIVTEFFDYECSACSMMAPVMEKVMAANEDVRFAFRDWTIFATRYPESAQASRSGLEIFRKLGADAYMKYHNGIYGTGHNEGRLTSNDIKKAASAVGAQQVITQESGLADRIIEANDSLAEMLGLTGTPGIIVMPSENATAANTTVLPGVVNEEVMQRAIELAKTK